MKPNIVVLGADTSELIGRIILSESFNNLSKVIIIAEHTRPIETRVLDEIILQRVRMESLILVNHIKLHPITKPDRKIWPKDHLVYKEQRGMGHVKHRSRRYTKRPF